MTKFRCYEVFILKFPELQLVPINLELGTEVKSQTCQPAPFRNAQHLKIVTSVYKLTFSGSRFCWVAKISLSHFSGWG